MFHLQSYKMQPTTRGYSNTIPPPPSPLIISASPNKIDQKGRAHTDFIAPSVIATVNPGTVQTLGALAIVKRRTPAGSDDYHRRAATPRRVPRPIHLHLRHLVAQLLDLPFQVAGFLGLEFVDAAFEFVGFG